MNDLVDAFGAYQRADGILEYIALSKTKRLSRSSLKKDSDTEVIIRLLVAHELVELIGEDKSKTLVLTEKGIKHLASGGFTYSLLPERTETPKKTFKQHLDDITGLLTIFGILNAVILFADQMKLSNLTNDPENLNLGGVEFISVSMYLISIMVLWEIIWITLNETHHSFKFQALYYLLCMTTLGIGFLFLNEYYSLLYGLGGILTFFGVSGGVFWLLLRALGLIITRRNAPWFVKYQKAISLALFAISIFTTLGLLMLIVSLFFKKS